MSADIFGFANGTRLRLGTPKSFNNLLGSVTVRSIASNDGPKAVNVRLNMICWIGIIVVVVTVCYSH